ncbi:MAG: tyrosine-type recombinase/integrase [Clostridiales bacterium]|nr:tyrosine-type recombinase/integrase [Clostridiales bacterium]
MEQNTLQYFADYLKESEHSPATIEKYLRDLRHFLTFAGADTLPDKQALLLWREELLRRDYCVSSINSMLAAVNRFFVSLGRSDCCVRPLRQQRRIFRDPGLELTREEYLRLLSAARSRKRRRLLLVMETICSTGIRVSELPYITVQAVLQGSASVRCKGKLRTILLPHPLCSRLREWMRQEKIREGCLFRTRSGKPLDRSNIWREMKSLCQEAGVEERKVFPHNLRHLFARTFYRLEKDLSKLADVLGHSSLETTRIYIMESTQAHERLLNRMCLLL